jgi:hypothetical protein
MTDDAIRTLERTAAATGLPEDKAKLLAERVRLGQLARDLVVYAAWCGDEASRIALRPQKGALFAGVGILSLVDRPPRLEEVPHELKFFEKTGALKIAADAAVAEALRVLEENGGGRDPMLVHCGDPECQPKNDEARIKAAVVATRKYAPGDVNEMDGGAITDQSERIRAAIRTALVRWVLCDPAHVVVVARRYECATCSGSGKVTPPYVEKEASYPCSGARNCPCGCRWPVKCSRCDGEGTVLVEGEV